MRVLDNLSLSRWLCALVWLLAGTASAGAFSAAAVDPVARDGLIDLRSVPWGQGRAFALDGLWQVYPGQLLSPQDLVSLRPAGEFPVPATWLTPVSPTSGVAHLDPGSAATPVTRLEAAGAVTYRLRIRVPSTLPEFFLYVPDMPSAVRLWANGAPLLERGRVALTADAEQPGFRPEVVRIPGGVAEIDLVMQVSNFHYREGGVWFSLELTDASGRFRLERLPLMLAVGVAGVLLALGLFNLTLYAYRRKERTALYFGLLCLVVGGRRLLIDERVLYWYDRFDWATLQRVEHLLFYLSLPLFIAFFAERFRSWVKPMAERFCWALTLVFVVLCIVLPNRLYTEFNLPFQLLVVVFLSWVGVVFSRVMFHERGAVADFAISLGVLCVAVLHDVLKANDVLATPNVAHFGVLAFAVSQSLTLQRSYLRNLRLVESMSRQLRSRNQELMVIDNVKDEFLATTSHELRTPLHGIAGLAKILLDEDHGRLDREQRRRVELIASTSDRLGALVNDILDFSSIRHGKIRLNPGRCDLAQLAEAVIRSLQPVIGDKDIALSARIDPAVQTLKVDAFRLQQVLFNLVGNAVKFTDEGYIQLTASEDGEGVLIEIADSGIGMAREQLRSLFRPYEPLSPDGRMGTGLGLTISRELVERHGGRLEIDSEQDQGTTVRVWLPAACRWHSASAEPVLPVTAPAAAQADPSNADADHRRSDDPPADPLAELPANRRLVLADTSSRVFVVDDEPVNRELVASLLHGQGMHLEFFAEGSSMLERLAQQTPDLVLLDYVMPGLDGLELCRRIRQAHDRESLPIMMVTARHRIEDIVDVLGAGANDYLIKPYFGPELVARVENLLQARRVRQTERENQALRQEMSRRQATETLLAGFNAQLLAVLDSASEGMLLVDEALRVVHLNEAAVQWRGPSGNLAVGTRLEALWPAATLLGLRTALRLPAGSAATLSAESTAEGPAAPALRVRRLEAEGELALAVVLQPVEAPNAGDPMEVIDRLAQELAESRARMDRLEGALRQFGIGRSPSLLPSSSTSTAVSASVTAWFQTSAMGYPEAASEPVSAPAAEATTVSMEAAPLAADPKALIVELHRSSLSLWERYTRRGKADLAERSRCWRVYIDGTTVKTRTFDKYLAVRSMPANPRWRAVVRTANFVLAECALSEEDRRQMMQLVHRVEEAFA